MVISASAVTIGFASLAFPAAAQGNYIGRALQLGGDFCPRDAVPGDGRLLGIARDTSLYTLYGTIMDRSR